MKEKTGRYQEKLKEKQADNLRAIKEKESQVRAKLKLRITAVNQPANPAHSRGSAFTGHSLMNATLSLHTHFSHPLPSALGR